MLYELLTGERLFKGEDVSETLVSVLRDEPDLTKVAVKARKLLRRCGHEVRCHQGDMMSARLSTFLPLACSGAMYAAEAE